MMMFSIVAIFASFSCLSVLAAPIPKFSRDAEGWPSTTSLSEAKSEVGYTSGNFQQKYLETIEGQPALVANYPEGSYAGAPSNPGIAGFIFDAKVNKDIESALEAVLTYDVKFQEGFQYAEGGKLPGFYGGDDPATAGKCAGGNHDNSCWSARIMWRASAKGELYFYAPTWNQKLPLCKGKCDVKYGATIGTGNFTFKTGEWNTVTERVRLNTPGAKVSDDEAGDGEIEVSANGGTINFPGLKLRSGLQGKIRGVMIHTFFGGSSSTKFRSPQDQKASFRNFKVEITKKLESSSGSSGDADSG